MSKQFNYKTLYNCPLCGKTFTDMPTGDLITRNDIVVIETKGKCRRSVAPRQNIIHHCSNGNIGFAEFIGFKRMEDEK